jgi:hypothetical protein
MRAQLVDPRDTQWEVDRPAYRVYFWRQLDGGVDAGWASEEWQIEGADVREVLAWADADASRRPYILYVCSTSDGEPGLIRLSGQDPTAQG